MVYNPTVQLNNMTKHAKYDLLQKHSQDVSVRSIFLLIFYNDIRPV